MAQTTVSQCYGTIVARYPCRKCGVSCVQKIARYTQARAVGANPGAAHVAAKRAKNLIATLIEEDLELIKTVDSKEFLREKGRSRRCKQCGYLEEWKRDAYKKNHSDQIFNIAIAPFALLPVVWMAFAANADSSVYMTFLPAIALFVGAGAFAFYTSKSFEKRIDKECAQMDSSISDKQVTTPTLEFTEEQDDFDDLGDMIESAKVAISETLKCFKRS